MPEAVLAGVDPTQPAIDALTGQPLTIEELLRRRGILATGGNSRMMPLQPSAATIAPPSSAGVDASGNGGGGVASPASAVPVTTTVDANGVPIPDLLNAFTNGGGAVDPAMAARAGESFDWLSPLAAGAGVAAGSVAAAALANRVRGRRESPKRELGDSLNKDGAAAAQVSAKVNGDIEDKTWTRRTRDVVDAEFEDIKPTGIATTLRDRKRLAAGNRDNRTSAAGPAKLNSATVTRDQVEKPRVRLPGTLRALPNYAADKGSRPNTRVEIGARQAVQSRVQPNGPTVALGDAYSDIPPAQMKEIESVADALIGRRMQGRDQARNRSSNVQRRAGLPTADPNRAAIINELVARIRANPNITKIITSIP